MYKKLENYFEHEDNRGKILGLSNSFTFEQINIVATNANCTRGNHYHKKTKELFIILEGEIEVSFQKVENEKLQGQKETQMFKKGDVFIVETNVLHTFCAKTDSKWLNCLSKRSASSDFFKIDP